MTIETTSMVSPPARVIVDPYGRNPLAEDYKQVNSATYALSERKAGPPPKMFDSGRSDLPAFTASGLDPRLLLQLPYRARHSVAANPDISAVHATFEQHAADPYLHLPHEGLSAAVQRVRDWASGRTDRLDVGQ